jgi:hypothetical protein
MSVSRDGSGSPSAAHCLQHYQPNNRFTPGKKLKLINVTFQAFCFFSLQVNDSTDRIGVDKFGLRHSSFIQISHCRTEWKGRTRREIIFT